MVKTYKYRIMRRDNDAANVVNSVSFARRVPVKWMRSVWLKDAAGRDQRGSDRRFLSEFSQPRWLIPLTRELASKRLFCRCGGEKSQRSASAVSSPTLSFSPKNLLSGIITSGEGRRWGGGSNHPPVRGIGVKLAAAATFKRTVSRRARS